MQTFENCKGNIKKTWRAINNIIEKNKQVSNILSTIHPDKINSGFQESINKIVHCLLNIESVNIQRIPLTLHFFYLTPVTPEEICKCTSLFSNSKAKDINSIPNHIMTQSVPILAQPLSRIFILSFLSGTFLNKMKLAKIIPHLQKSGDSNISDKYRPISLLLFLSKLLERLVYNRLISFLNKHSTIAKQQFGFRKNRSTSNALIYFNEQIL